MLLFVVSLFWLSAVSAVSPLLRVADLPALGSACGNNRSRFRTPFRRLRLFRTSLPSGRPPLTIFNVVTQGPLARPASAGAPSRVAEGESPRPRAEVRPAPAPRAGQHPRVPIVFVLDKSPSEALHQEEIYAAMRAAVAEMRLDPVTASCVEVCFVEFNSQAVASRFVAIADAAPTELLPVQGGTYLGLATAKTLDVTEARLAELRAEGVLVKRTLVVILSDFVTQDSLDVLSRLRATETADKNFAVLPVGVGEVNTDVMNAFSSKRRGQLLRTEGGVPEYKAFFNWIKLVVGLMSRTGPEAEVALPPTDEWRRA